MCAEVRLRNVPDQAIRHTGRWRSLCSYDHVSIGKRHICHIPMVRTSWGVYARVGRCRTIGPASRLASRRLVTLRAPQNRTAPVSKRLRKVTVVDCAQADLLYRRALARTGNRLKLAMTLASVARFCSNVEPCGRIWQVRFLLAKRLSVVHGPIRDAAHHKGR